MTESKILVDGKSIKYNGLFRLQEIYALIRRFYRERGYYMIEKVNDEQLLENGKQVLVELDPQKKYNHYAQGRIKTKIFIKGLVLIIFTSHKRT